MRILVFNGSPKKDKSDTMHITRAFLEGMQEAAPQDIRIIDVIDQHIEYCRGCFACKQNGGTCRHQDDMRGILEEILASDLLLFSFPLYGYGMPAPLKNLIDRTMPLSSMAMQKVGDRYEHVGQANYEHHRAGKPDVQCPGGGDCDRAEAGAGQAGGQSVRRKRRDRRGPAGADRLAHDSGGNLRTNRQRRRERIRHAP